MILPLSTTNRGIATLSGVQNFTGAERDALIIFLKTLPIRPGAVRINLSWWPYTYQHGAGGLIEHAQDCHRAGIPLIAAMPLREPWQVLNDYAHGAFSNEPKKEMNGETWMVCDKEPIIKAAFEMNVHSLGFDPSEIDAWTLNEPWGSAFGPLQTPQIQAIHGLYKALLPEGLPYIHNQESHFHPDGAAIHGLVETLEADAVEYHCYPRPDRGFPLAPAWTQLTRMNAETRPVYCSEAYFFWTTASVWHKIPWDRNMLIYFGRFMEWIVSRFGGLAWTSYAGVQSYHFVGPTGQRHPVFFACRDGFPAYYEMVRKGAFDEWCAKGGPVD